MILTDGTHPVTLPQPEFGYRVEMSMPLVYSRRLDGSYGIKDASNSYDRRKCLDLRLTLDETQARDLYKLLREDDRGRGSTLTLQLGATATGFFPFGPDKGDANSFTCRARIVNSDKMHLEPWRYFQPTLELAYVSGPDSAYTWSDTVHDGTLQVGRIGGVGYPQDGYKVSADYGVEDTITQAGNAYENDFGEAAESYETRPALYGRYSKMASLVNHLLAVVRGNNMTVVFPDYSYPWGPHNDASGSFTVQPLYTSINPTNDCVVMTLTHTHHNYFTMEFGMRKV